MVDRPNLFPEWATENQIDPVSGQNNVVAPNDELKKSGYTRAKVSPRQYTNWLFRNINLWLQYLDQEIQAIENKESVSPDPDTIALRDTEGRTQFTDPSAGQDAANKQWVESNWSVQSDPDTVVLRDANGRSQIADPASDLDIINRQWFDSQVDTKTAFRYTVGSLQTLPDQSWTVVSFDTTDFTVNAPDLSTSELTIPRNGIYCLNAIVDTNLDDSLVVRVAFNINSSRFIVFDRDWRGEGVQQSNIFQGSTLQQLSQNDTVYVEIYVNQSAGTREVNGGGEFSGFLLR